MFDTLDHFVATLCDLSNIAFIKFVVVLLYGTFELLLFSFVLLQLLLHILFLFLLPLLEFSDAPFIVDVAETAARQVATRLVVVVLLRFRLHTAK